jgi:hypothetical protein
VTDPAKGFQVRCIGYDESDECKGGHIFPAYGASEMDAFRICVERCERRVEERKRKAAVSSGG